jgi:hypothetical protein
MKYNNLTLRELLIEEELATYLKMDKYYWVFDYINKKDQHDEHPPTYEQTKKQYAPVIEELLSKPKVKPYKYPILVNVSRDPFNEEEYVEVCLLNLNYKIPPKGLKPWGCKKGECPPEGHYNANDDNYSKYFAFGWDVPWSKIIDTPVVVEGKAQKISRWGILGEILWELTFYGWTESKVTKNLRDIDKQIKKAKDDIKKGKYIEIPPPKKGGYKVVVPDTVVKQLSKIISKSTTPA